MLAVGAVVEEFELLNQHHQPIKLTDLVGDGSAVLFFYVKAKTPG